MRWGKRMMPHRISNLFSRGDELKLSLFYPFIQGRRLIENDFQIFQLEMGKEKKLAYEF